MARNKYIKTGFLIHTSRKRAENHALLDTGATECFIHPRLVNKLGLKERPLRRPQNVRNIDGTINQAGKTTMGVELTLKLNGKPCDHLFFVTDIGEDDVILGYPFFESFNPTIDWEKGQLSGEVVAITKGEENLSPRIAKTTMATQLAVQVKKDKKTWDQIVPKQYHQYGKVFQEDASEQFPGPRKWDHAIDLKLDAPTSLDCRIYPLSPAEKQAQKEFIATNLRLGRIRRSKSQYACGFFFVGKKDGKLRPVQDYRKLNEWTIPNRYPLPLITDLIHDLVDKKLFTKFDVRWGYNNI
jgi:predicted aspartyl protease